MLQARRSLYPLIQRPYRIQRRCLADVQPPDPTTSNRQPGEAIGGGESSGTPSEHAASAGQHEPTHHASHPEPRNEDLGRGFYVSIAALALSFAVYKFSRSSTSDPASAGDPAAQPFFTRIIHYYRYLQDEFTRRNTLHTDMVEQAGEDRNLFQSSSWTHHVDLKFPETFNTGSPYNIPAGHSADLSALIAHYEKRNAEAEAARLEKSKEAAADSETQERRRAETSSERRPKSFLESLGLTKPDS